MSEPNILIGKFLFYAIIVAACIGPIILYLSYQGLKARCSRPEPTTEPTKKKSNKKRNIIIICILAGLTAQAVNYSYTFFRLKPISPS